jgi:Fe-S cluster assembly protein SufD
MVALSAALPLAGTTHPWTAALLEAFDAAAAGPGAQEARLRLAAAPFPSRHQEAWRFTDPSPLLAVTPQRIAAEPAAAAALPPPAAGVTRLRLDGGADPLAGVVLPPGLEPLPPGELNALLAQGPFPGRDSADSRPAVAAVQPWCGLLAAAGAAGVLALRLRQSASACLELVSDCAGAAGVLPLRLVLVLESDARLELLQVHRAAGASLTAVLVEAHLAPGAHLHHGFLGQAEDPAAVLLAELAVRQQPGSTYGLTSAVAGWGLSRLEPRLLQESGAASSTLRSLQRVDGEQRADQHSLVHLAGPDGRVEQLHKVIADGAGRSVFDGAVQVPRSAQRTEAAQLSRGLLLSDRARIDSKPQLEIVADDVRCTHGATVTRLQQEELFYLRSRGIDSAAAGRLLLRGFCSEVLESLPAAASIWHPLSMALGDPPPAEAAPR